MKMNRKIVTDISNVVQIFEIVFVLMILLLIIGTEFEILNVHAFHSASAWLFLMVQGLLVLRAINPIIKKILGKDKVFNHWVLETLGLVEVTLGFLCAYKSKNYKNKEHFLTWHAQLGLIGYALSLFSGLNGIPALYRKELRNYISPELNKYFHIVTGTLGFTFGGLSLITSMYSKWYIKKTYSSFVSFILGIFLITSIVGWTLIEPIKKVRNNWKKLTSKVD